MPDQIGRYNILKKMGQGGMGTVFHAHDPDLDREVVIKVISPSTFNIDGRWRDRFRREVQVASRFNHPHIVTIFDVGLELDSPYVVMELLAGGTLEKRFQEKALTWTETLILLRLLADALSYAHQMGIVHRDVKPANIMFAGEELHTLKLVDFGLASWQRGSKLTQEGVAMGTPAYMSPEQAQGLEVDRRADIFALGIILFEAIMGYSPLDKGSSLPTLIEAASSKQIDVSPLVDKAPPEVVNLIRKASAKDPEQRHQTCEELLEDLDRYLDDVLEDTKSFRAALINSTPRRPSAPHSSSAIAEIADVEIELPYGTMTPGSKFYIEREADAAGQIHIDAPNPTTLFIQAPRQMGKSSLLRRMLHQANLTYNRPSVFVDFQKFSRQHFGDEEQFLIEFCLMIGDALKIPDATERYWKGRRNPTRKCSLYLTEYIIPKVKRPFILALDEVERIFDSSFRIDFFGMLRTWHNDRAGIEGEGFALMSLFLSSSTEPYLFIEDPHQSPFNVAETILLQAFSQEEVEDLNRRHKSPLEPEQVGALLHLVGGHPFLTRIALYQVAMGKLTFETLLAKATHDDGPFGEHLRHYYRQITNQPALTSALTTICRTHTCPDERTLERLKGAGLVIEDGERVLLRNRLYDRYFKERLNATSNA